MTNEKPDQTTKDEKPADKAPKQDELAQETGGFGEKGNGKPEPTRYNDWEVDGRCSDF